MNRDCSKDLEVCEKATPGKLSREALPCYIKKCMELEVQVGQLRGALEEVVYSPNVFEDERIDYVEKQICKESLNFAEKILQTPVPARWEKTQKVVDLAKKWKLEVLARSDGDEAIDAGLALMDAIKELEGCGE